MEKDNIRKIEKAYQVLRAISVFLAVIIPILFTALNSHQPILFSIIMPATPFAFIAVLSTPPDTIYLDKPFTRAGALIFANIGTLLITLSYNIFYDYRITHFSGSGSGTDTNLGMIMMSMPISLLIGISIFALVGEKVGSNFKMDFEAEKQDLDEAQS
jgi:hypothetical protein